VSITRHPQAPSTRPALSASDEKIKELGENVPGFLSKFRGQKEYQASPATTSDYYIPFVRAAIFVNDYWAIIKGQWSV
jgi:hypothetical protein